MATHVIIKAKKKSHISYAILTRINLFLLLKYKAKTNGNNIIRIEVATVEKIKY